jgi:hypothetical protein
MACTGMVPLRWLMLAALLAFALTSCKRHPPGKKTPTVDPGNIQAVTLVTPASATSVPLYSKVELKVAFKKTSTTKPYEPDPTKGGMNLNASFTGPGGTFTVPGFYNGTEWRVRFAPTGVGKWTYTVSYQDPDSKGTSATGNLTCVASAYPGFARIQGRYLMTSNGATLFPVGHNNGWQANVEMPTFTDMAGRGENLLAFWNSMPWMTPSGSNPSRVPIENVTGGVGNYDQNACSYLDGLADHAEAAGVFLQPTIWAHGELRVTGRPALWGEGNWDNNAYSALAGITDPVDFFTMSTGAADTEQWRLQKNFLRYLFARYGYSRAIIHWVVIAEINGTTGGSEDPASVNAWLTAVHSYWANMDFYRRNAALQHPLAAFYTNQPGVETGMDTRSVDSYDNMDSNVAAGQAIGPQTLLMGLTGKPCFHGEFGGRLPPAGTASEPAHAHNGIWSGVSAGACMTPLHWCDNGSWPLLTDVARGGDAIRNHLQCVGSFMSGITYLNDATLVSQEVGGGVPGFHLGYSTRLNDRGFAWVQNPVLLPLNFTVTGLDAGTYHVERYDVFSGTTPVLLSSVDIPTVLGTLTIPYDAAKVDVAFKFSRTGVSLGGTSFPAPPATATGVAVESSAPPADAPEDDAPDEPCPEGDGWDFFIEEPPPMSGTF